MTSETKFYGKYRGTVRNNVDPMQMGRIQVEVPEVTGIGISSWAMPCFPVAGLQMGLVAVPPLQAGVWVEYEKGDSDYPIWSGCFIGSVAEMPALAMLSQPPLSAITLQTTLQNGLTVTDLPGPTGGILLKSTTGASISVNDTGIYIQNGKGASIVMVGPAVNINNGALNVV